MDHVYVTHKDRIVESFVPVYGLSDHYPVLFVHKFRGKNNPKFHHETIFHRKLKSIDRLSFLDDLNSAPWSLLEVFQDVNDKLDIWDLIFNEVLGRRAPLIKKRVKSKQLPPWLNDSILNHMLRSRDQFKARAKSNILANVLFINDFGMRSSR